MNLYESVTRNLKESDVIERYKREYNYIREEFKANSEMSRAAEEWDGFTIGAFIKNELVKYGASIDEVNDKDDFFNDEGFRFCDIYHNGLNDNNSHIGQIVDSPSRF